MSRINDFQLDSNESSHPSKHGPKTRRRSSIEHDIMLQKLKEWQAKKGLPVSGPYQEEQDRIQHLRAMPNIKAVHATPLSGRIRPHNCLTESKERKTQKTLKTPRSETPGISSSNEQTLSCSHWRPCAPKMNQPPGRRSLALSTKKNTSLHSAKKIKPNNIETPIPTKVARRSSVNIVRGTPLQDVTNTSPIYHPVSPSSSKDDSREDDKEMDDGEDQEEEMETSHQPTGSKSVRFASPREDYIGTGMVNRRSAGSAENTPCTPTAAVSRIDMRERLEKWMVAKGKTPSRFRNFLGYESSLVWSGPRRRSVKSRTSTPGRIRKPLTEKTSCFQSQTGDPIMDTMNECLVLLQEGCPACDMSAWLDGIVAKVPIIQQCSTYWLCRANIAEKLRGDEGAVECLEEALEFGAEPIKEINETLAAYKLKLKLASEEAEEDCHMRLAAIKIGDVTPLRCSPRLMARTPTTTEKQTVMGHQSDGDREDEEETGRQTHHASDLNIKYSLTETTPYFSRIQQALGNSAATPSVMATPVRRSARLDDKRRSVAAVGGGQPTPAREVCVDSLQDVISVHPDAQVILRPNRALAAEFAEAEFNH